MNADLLPHNKTILYTVLNWGLGHATRSIPIIQELLNRNNIVIIASDGFPLKYLQEEFKQCEYKLLTSYNIKYPFKSISLNMVYNLPNIAIAYFSEKSRIKKITSEHKIDLIITDHRLGCRKSGIKSVLISHQQQPFHDKKWIKYLFKKVHYYFIKRFDEVWVPDEPNVNLSGELSILHQSYPPLIYLGITSRFKVDHSRQKKYISAILSGPEPQRTDFEKKVVSLFNSLPEYEKILVRGTDVAASSIIDVPRAIIYDYLPSKKLELLLNESHLVICRSGYSSLMDLYATKTKAIVVPTPGQAEQEYLAKHNANKFTPINECDLLNSIDEIKKSIS
ncbi:MAG: hypothetical protein RLZZ546_1972 [Bacteroidota bacterium]|jgi:uncharacterized protein (TIGR00661 family)